MNGWTVRFGPPSSSAAGRGRRGKAARCRVPRLAKLAGSRHIEVVDASAETPRSRPVPRSTNLRYGCDRYAISLPHREGP
jgi:hypothetical protein